jgi:glycosyltransferase involved in cell wall biosynthesis
VRVGCNPVRELVTWRGTAQASAVIVPFKDGFDALARCLASVLAGLPEGARLVAIDDGSRGDPTSDPALAALLKHPALVLTRHDRNRGPAAARNTGLQWCWQNGVDTVILLDADCVVPANFVQCHLAHHHAHRDALGIAGAIEGSGDGFWSHVDMMLSWFTSVPRSDCDVDFPYHPPTTNLSFKLHQRNRRLLRLNERLRTGEDVALFRRIRNAGERVRFITAPRIVHLDRHGFAAVLSHQYRWGLHTFAVRSGRLNAPIAARLAFVLAFVSFAPVYAALGTWLNMRLWLRHRRRDWYLVPLVYLAYLLKAAAAIHGTIVPSAALYPPNNAAADQDPRTHEAFLQSVD